MTISGCERCGALLEGRRTRWCSDECANVGARDSQLKSHFNITIEEYDAILAAQKGLCGICERRPAIGVNLPVDHDHDTGFVRGLLCYRCNRYILGNLTIAMVLKILRYLKSPPAEDVIGQRRVPEDQVKPKRRRGGRRKK